MAFPRDRFPGSVAQANRIRCVFLAFVVYFIIGMIVRKELGQPYPGLFMPAFPGMGLKSMSAHEGEIVILEITIRFRDQTAVKTTARQLFGGDIYPPSVASRFFLHDPADAAKQLPVPDDAKAFLKTIVSAKYPRKEVESVAFVPLLESFPLDQPGQRKVIEPLQPQIVDFPQ